MFGGDGDRGVGHPFAALCGSLHSRVFVLKATACWEKDSLVSVSIPAAAFCKSGSVNHLAPVHGPGCLRLFCRDCDLSSSLCGSRVGGNLVGSETTVGLSGLQKYHSVPRMKEQRDQRQNLPT